MSAQVLPSARNLPALAVSLALHGSLVLFPFIAARLGQPPVMTTESVAFQGNSLEVDAPTPELGAAAEQEVAVEPQPAPEAPAVPTPAPAEADNVPEAEPAAPAHPAPPTRPTPKPRTTATKPPPSAAPASSAAASSSGADAPTGNAPGSFGAEGLPPGVRRLGYGFTRAIPVVTPSDSAWRELPVGLVGIIRIELTLGENNRVEALRVLPPRRGEPPTEPALERMAARTLAQLKIGQFALSGSNDPGKELLAIEVRLRDAEADDEPKGLVVQKGFEGATPGHPGRAYFRYDTGRWFEAKVTIVAAKD